MKRKHWTHSLIWSEVKVERLLVIVTAFAPENAIGADGSAKLKYQVWRGRDVFPECLMISEEKWSIETSMRLAKQSQTENLRVQRLIQRRSKGSVLSIVWLEAWIMKRYDQPYQEKTHEISFLLESGEMRSFCELRSNECHNCRYIDSKMLNKSEKAHWLFDQKHFERLNVQSVF